jgi:branched-chain amino acid aminotransferase
MTVRLPKKALVALPDLSIVAPEEAKVSAFDRSFHFGDSLYEVTRSYDGVLFSLDEHLRRLVRSTELAMFEVPIDTGKIGTQVREACRAFFRKFGNLDVYVRVTLSRGAGDLNIDRATSSEPYSLVYVKELEQTPAKAYSDGVHYAVVERRRNLPSALDPAMKSGNYLNNVLALAEAKKLGAQDAIMLNWQGFVTEGTTNNVYMVKDGEVWTAPLSVGILAGITRDWIELLSKKEKIVYQDRLYTASELFAADEVFFSSSTKEIVPITTLNGRPVADGKPGPVTKRLHKALKALIADYTQKHRAESLYS